MFHANRFLSLLAIGSLGLPAIAFAQAEQVLKDAWTATSQTIYDIDPESGSLVGPKNPADGPRDFQAIAFEAPQLGGLGAARNLIAVDGTEILRYYNGTNESAANPGGDNPELLYDAADNPAGLRYVNTAAVASDGSILFSGYSKRKRQFELWAIDPDAHAPNPRAVATGTPQLTDSVFVSSEDIANPLNPLAGGGLLAAAGREVLFLPAGNYGSYFALADVRNLPVRNNTKILSAAFVADTDFLVLLLDTRDILTIDLITGTQIIASVPNLGLPNPACADQRTQVLKVRNVGTQQSDAVNVVADACGQVLAHSFDTANPGDFTFDALVAPSASVKFLAVGEGNAVKCDAGVTCTLTSGYEADSDVDAELLVLKVNDLCDVRVPVVPPLGCYDPTYVAANGGKLILNDILPAAIQNSLAARGVTIVIPPYMYAAAPDARFGAVFVQADELSRDSLVSARLELSDLLTFSGLGVVTGAPQGTPVINLINSDVVAYAPDNPAFPTVRGFEATPVTVGEGSVAIRKRGYSVDIYGLMHDVAGASSRTAIGGTTMLNPTGAPPRCNLVQGGQQFVAPNDKAAYFFNLTACLFADLELLLTGSTIPSGAYTPAARAALIDRLGNVEDKLIKALNAALPSAGPNAGETTFQSTIQQLDQFDALLHTTPVAAAWKIYKNELIVRSEVLRFNLLERADPTIDP